MASPITLRLDDTLRRQVERIAHRKKVSTSEVIREAINAWVERQEVPASPYDAIADLVGTVHGGDTNLSTNTGQRFARLLKTRGHRK